ncbi:MAG: polyprenyl synthetase family protein [Chloroflexi bacterium]|nr:polyprenyl synthetase family protein [Chloroflexota bacterium]
MTLPRAFHRYREETDKELASIVGRSDLVLYDMMRYHLGWIDEAGRPVAVQGGKLVRPTLCLLSCEAVGGDWHMALPAAAAVELVNSYSLIHDDIEDGDEKRRGRATVWRIWGQPQAINAGDTMHALAMLAILSLEEKGVAPVKVVRAATILDQAGIELCQGQYLDISYEDRFDINIDAYLQMADGKTAALIACSLELGALLGTEEQELLLRFHRLGRKLGLAYQMKNDVLGIWSSGSPASDIKKKKKTLPVIYALERAKGKEREQLLRIYNKKTISSEDVDRAVQLLSHMGAKEYTEEMARRYYREALAELEEVNLPLPAKEELREVAAFVVEREY